MELSEKPRFMEMLGKAMTAYGKPLPESSIVTVWWDLLQPYPLRTVGAAFRSYLDENGEFAPVPAGIAKRCKLMDGRPGEEEAWALALLSRDEADTVVWTQEIAEAFGIARPVLETSGEITARKTFIEAYNRIVSQARFARKPVAWNVSLGWDMKKREAAIEKANVAGLLPAPTVQALLPNYAGPGADESCPEGLKRVKEELARLQDGWARAAEQRAAEVAAEREAQAAKKREIAEQVAAYETNVIPMRAQA